MFSITSRLRLEPAENLAFIFNDIPASFDHFQVTLFLQGRAANSQREVQPPLGVGSSSSLLLAGLREAAGPNELAPRDCWLTNLAYHKQRETSRGKGRGAPGARRWLPGSILSTAARSACLMPRYGVLGRLGVWCAPRDATTKSGRRATCRRDMLECFSVLRSRGGLQSVAEQCSDRRRQ